MTKSAKSISKLGARSEHDDCSGQPDIDVASLAALMCDTAIRLAPAGSQYTESVRSLMLKLCITNSYIVPHDAGILRALRDAYNSLLGVEKFIHTDIFADFVEMADYLLSEGRKDPAAVVLGSTL